MSLLSFPSWGRRQPVEKTGGNLLLTERQRYGLSTASLSGGESDQVQIQRISTTAAAPPAGRTNHLCARDPLESRLHYYTQRASRDLDGLPNMLHRNSTWYTRKSTGISSSNHRFSPSTHFPFLLFQSKAPCTPPFFI